MAKPFMPFVLSPPSYFGLALNNKNVVEQYKDPRFRDALRYMASLYSEGLILPDSFSMRQDEKRTLMSAATPLVGVSASPWPHHHMVLPSQRVFEYMEVRALQGPTGLRHASNMDPWSIITGCYYVTDKAKNPELAVALYDYLIKFDVMMDSYIGPKGKAWTDPAPGTLSILNLPASHRMLVTYGSQVQNTTWDQASPMIRNKTFRGGEEATNVPQMVDYITNRRLSLIPQLMTNMSFTNEGWWYLSAKENEKYAIPQSMFIPPMAFNDADNTRMADINAVLVDYKKQVMVEFITGRRNINNDSDWNNYLTELDRNGSAELTRIIQKYIR
jgi:putative aldouronate transport system substrate-binding protein